MSRRIARTGEPAALDVLVTHLAGQSAPETQLAMLQGIAEGLRGRRQVPMPAGWPKVSAGLLASKHAEVNSQATALALVFGDPQALAKMRSVLVDRQAPLPERTQALDALLATKDGQLAPTLQELLGSREMRAAALRGLAAYDDDRTPAAILGAYPKFTIEEKRDALGTLAARPKFAEALLAAVAEKQVAASDLSADLVRQLRNLDDPTINDQITKLWGIARKSSEEKSALIEQVTRTIKKRNAPPADAWLGRAVFAKTCAQCHTLFGAAARSARS